MLDVLVHIDAPDCFSPLLALARKAVEGLDARMRILWVDNPPVVPSFVRAQMGEGVDQVQRQLAQQTRDAVHAAFLAQADQTCQWVEERGQPALVAARHGRCCDLIIVAQPDWSGGAQDGEAHVGEELLFQTGRPVLFLPRQGEPASLGRNIVVAWNDSAQAARALHDALPFLKKADTLSLIGAKGDNADSVLAHLDHHGLKPKTIVSIDETADPGHTILEFCLKQGADMLVMGAYGHSRLREFVLGGATRFVLKHQHIGVFMAH